MAKSIAQRAADRFTDAPRAARVLIAIALGAFAALGHDLTAGGFLFVFLAFVAAFVCVPAASKAAAGFGWLMGLGYFGVTLRWIIEPFLVDVARHGWMAPFALVLLAGGLALFWGVAFWAARVIAGPRATVMLWLPVTLAAVELVRGHIFTGFPWGMVSYVWIGEITEGWFAIVGPYGAGLLVFWGAGVFAHGIMTRRVWGWALSFSVILTVPIIVGLANAASKSYADKRVRVIQPNVPQHEKWDRALMPAAFDRAIALTGAGDPVDAVFWPETSIPAPLDYAGTLLARVSRAARGAPVVAGIQRVGGLDYYNSAILIEDGGDVMAITDKTHLVPFGEYIPLADVLRPLGLGTLVDQVAGFTPGTGDGMIEIPGLGRVRVLICYEGIFPEEIQRGDTRPDVLLILTNDAWFGNGPGPRQHLTQARARAIEQGLPVIRSANTGISAVIDPHGNIIAQLPLNTAGHLDAVVPRPLPPTIYARVGDWPLAFVLFFVLAAGVMRRPRLAVDPAHPRG